MQLGDEFPIPLTVAVPGRRVPDGSGKKPKVQVFRPRDLAGRVEKNNLDKSRESCGRIPETGNRRYSTTMA